jgi:hypothetical protein
VRAAAVQTTSAYIDVGHSKIVRACVASEMRTARLSVLPLYVALTLYRPGGKDTSMNGPSDFVDSKSLPCESEIVTGTSAR